MKQFLTLSANNSQRKANNWNTSNSFVRVISNSDLKKKNCPKLLVFYQFSPRHCCRLQYFRYVQEIPDVWNPPPSQPQVEHGTADKKNVPTFIFIKHYQKHNSPQSVVQEESWSILSVNVVCCWHVPCVLVMDRYVNLMAMHPTSSRTVLRLKEPSVCRPSG